MGTASYLLFRFSGSIRVVVYFLILISIILVTPAFSEMRSVRGEKVNLRSGPGKTYSVKWEYGSGFPVQIISKKGDWLKTKDFENDTGWIHNSLLSSRPYVIVKANRNKDVKINIRKGPGSTNKIVGQAYYGVVFKVLKHQSGWVNVRHDSGLTGWVSSNLLWGN